MMALGLVPLFVPAGTTDCRSAHKRDFSTITSDLGRLAGEQFAAFPTEWVREDGFQQGMRSLTPDREEARIPFQKTPQKTRL